MKEHPRT